MILEFARKSDYPDFSTFQKALLTNSLSWKKKRLGYRSGLYQTRLTFFADYSKVPEIDGVSVNYNPPKAYDSPFIQGDFGSGAVTIRKDRRELVLDFTEE